jgi:hypothetical protein
MPHIKFDQGSGCEKDYASLVEGADMKSISRSIRLSIKINKELRAKNKYFFAIKFIYI